MKMTTENAIEAAKIPLDIYKKYIKIISSVYF